ncbi:MAG: hypothetical protein COB78_11950 [Hyphomicrobiales bacterium]|nr:MAG: hypothetical protein COB78_11950 [Hyphomicrobiales bacterium]
MIKLLRRLILMFVFVFLAPLAVHAVVYSQGEWPSSWRTADWSSSRTLPSPQQNTDAMVRIYSARTGRWKGIFAVHSWLVIKRQSETQYHRYDVVGWGRPVRHNDYAADAFWYSSMPELQYEVTGAAAQALIPKIENAITNYPYNNYGGYILWPGPNSNSFIAHVIRSVPELQATLPPTAIGKDFIGYGNWLSPAPSNTGWQLSFMGYAGIVIAEVEGLEINILGLVAGIDFLRPAIKLPGFGRIGMPRSITVQQ